MQDWDVLVLWPIVTVIVLCAYFFVLHKVGINKRRQWFYVLQHGLFWFTFAITLNLNYNFSLFNLGQNYGNWGFLIAGSVLLYAAIFFIPASWMSGLLRSRRIYFWISYACALPGIVIALFVHQQWGFAVGTVLVGVGLASNSLWYLCFNEVFCHSTRPFSSLVILIPNVFLSTIGGVNLLNFIKHFHLSNNGSNVENIIIMVISLVALAISVLFNLLLPEREILIGAFEAEFLQAIAPFKWRKVIIILVLLFILGAVRELCQGDIANMLLAQNAWNWYHNAAIVKKLGVVDQNLWWITQIAGVGILSLLFARHVKLKFIFSFACALWVFYLVLASTIHQPIVVLVLQLLNGTAIGMLFAILFAVAIMWNYRVAARPVTGCFSATNAFVGFLFQLLERVMVNNHVGIFQFLANDTHHNPADKSWWSAPYLTENYASYLSQLQTLYLVLSLVAVFLVIVVAVYFFIKVDYIAGEYAHYNDHLINAVDLLVNRAYARKFTDSKTTITRCFPEIEADNAKNNDGLSYPLRK